MVRVAKSINKGGSYVTSPKRKRVPYWVNPLTVDVEWMNTSVPLIMSRLSGFSGVQLQRLTTRIDAGTAELSLRMHCTSPKPGAFTHATRELQKACGVEFAGRGSPWNPIRIPYESLHALVIAFRGRPELEYMVVSEAGEVIVWA